MSEVETWRQLARITEGAPHPVLRIRTDGVLTYANPAAAPILAAWGCQQGQPVPAPWAARFALISATGTATEVELDLADQQLSLCVYPTPSRDHVVAYGYDLEASRGPRQASPVPAERRPPQELVRLHPDPVITVREGRITYANAAAAPLLAAWSAHAGGPVPDPLHDLLPRGPLASGEVHEARLQVRGQPVLLRMVAGDDGRSVHVYGAPSAQGLASTILAGMSHELRTPLNAIVGYAELIADELGDRGDDQLVADLRKITASADALRRMYGDLLELARVEAGRVPLAVDRFEVADLVDDVVLAVSASVEAAGDTLDVRVDLHPPEMVGDASKVRRVLAVLLANAVRHTRDGRITVSVAREGRRVLMRVGDTGTQLDAGQRASLGRRSGPADVAPLVGRTADVSPASLGLAIARLLCDRMGATLTVEAAPERGATFTVSLPATLEG